MRIIIPLLIWTIISVVYFISRIGYKNPSRGIRKYIEYFIMPPTMIIISVIFCIRYAYWLTQPADEPVVTIGQNRVDGFMRPGKPQQFTRYPDKQFSRQIRVNGEKGSSWIVNVYSNDEIKVDVLSDKYEFVHEEGN